MAHSWQFFRAGGVDQVVIRTGSDIAHLPELDQKLWVALACPTHGTAIDSRTLDFIDTDHDGRIRPPELLAACDWACAQLKNPDLLLHGSDTLAIGSLNAEQEYGSQMAEEAGRILELLGKDRNAQISLADVADRGKLLAAMRFNGDGVITVKTPEDDALRQVVQRIIDTYGGVPDRSGDTGINKEKVEAFFKDAAALRDWAAGPADYAPAHPLGDATPVALDAVAAVREKVDDFFTRCRFAAYDVRALAGLNPSAQEYEALGAHPLTLETSEMAALPLARIEANRDLPLLRGVNPAWAGALQTLKERVIDPVLGEPRETLDETSWRRILTALDAAQKWLGAKPQTQLGALELKEIDALTQGSAQARLLALIEDDAKVEVYHERITDLEKLLRYKRDLLKLLNNFVAFKDFYRREGAIFQAGTLYLDSRSCDLTVQVSDVNKHAGLAGLAKACLAYCECTRQGEKMFIAAAFTAGDTDFLFVGRNGVFYDRERRDWDATIVKLIDNPTSVRQAFFSPYKKFLRMIEEQVAKRAAASDASVQDKMGAAAANVAAVGKPGTDAGQAAQPGDAAAAAAAGNKQSGPRIDVGTVAALGVALGSISAVIVGVFAKFVDLGVWIPVALVGVILAISGPSMLIAWLKLRQRSLGPILDASGWAVNGRMGINTRLGASLSQLAKVPLNGKRPLSDPYAEQNGLAALSWGAGTLVALVILLVVAWRLGWLAALWGAVLGLTT